MKKYTLTTLQVLVPVLILILGIANIIPATAIQYLLIAAFCILICDLAYEAILSIINLRLFDTTIYVCIGTICLIAVSGIKEALICLLILRIFSLIFNIFYNTFKSKLLKLTNKLTPESELIPGDTVTLNPYEILSVDCILLDSCGLFVPVFSSSGSAPTEFLQGDEVPGGFRLVSDTPVDLHVTTHYEDSTFTKYMHAFENSTSNSYENTWIISFLPRVFLILGIIGTVISMFIPEVAGTSALLIFLTCCIFLPAKNIITFFDKFQLYSFQKGVLLTDNLTKLAKTKAFYIAKSAIIKTTEYTITDICPSKASMDKATLLKYAAQAEAPYAHTGIGNTLIKEYASEVLLSAVKHTELYPELGILTKYNNDTIHAGCKEFFITRGINKLPNFEIIEAGFNVNDTFIYIALNNTYIGYIILHAPFKNSYNEFLNYITKKNFFTKVILHSSPDEADVLIATKQRLQKKCRTAYVAYIDSKPTDSALQSMSDYNIFLGSGGYCHENDFCDVTIIPNSFKTLLRTIQIAKKVYFTANLYTVLLLLIKAGLITASFLLPDIKVWYVLLTDGIISTILIKVYDLLFRLFTRFN